MAYNTEAIELEEMLRIYEPAPDTQLDFMNASQGAVTQNLEEEAELMASYEQGELAELLELANGSDLDTGQNSQCRSPLPDYGLDEVYESIFMELSDANQHNYFSNTLSAENYTPAVGDPSSMDLTRT